MSQVFICYRRDDSAGHAGRLFDHLVDALGDERVFMDVSGEMQPGTDFVVELERRVEQCEVLVAVIGRGWLATAPGTAQAKIFSTQDFVRRELARGLRNDGRRRVIPVLLNGAVMPLKEQLPDDLQELPRKQALKIEDDGFKEGVDRLIAAIRRGPRSRWLRSPLLVAIPVLALLGVGVWKALSTATPSAGAVGVASSERTFQARSAAIEQLFRDELVTRFGSDGWITVEVNVQGKDPWAQWQALAALLSTKSSSSLADSVLKKPIEVAFAARNADGWGNGDFHKYPHLDPVLWAGLALDKVTSPSAIGDVAGLRKELWVIADQYRQGAAWHAFPRRVESRPSLYGTAMGLLLLVESRVESGKQDAGLERAVRETSSWLARQARYQGGELQGWAPQTGSTTVSIGTSFVAAYALMRAGREAGADKVSALGAYVPAQLRKLGGAPPSIDQNDDYYFLGTDGGSRLTHQVRITWSPWMVAAAAEWLRSFGATAPAEDVAVVRRAWGDVLSALERQSVQDAFVFTLAEHLFVLARTHD